LKLKLSSISIISPNYLASEVGVERLTLSPSRLFLFIAQVLIKALIFGNKKPEILSKTSLIYFKQM
jgi:hypothetical protein